MSRILFRGLLQRVHAANLLTNPHIAGNVMRLVVTLPLYFVNKNNDVWIGKVCKYNKLAWYYLGKGTTLSQSLIGHRHCNAAIL